MWYGLASIVFPGGILKVYNEFILSPGDLFYFEFVLPKVELMCTCIVLFWVLKHCPGEDVGVLRECLHCLLLLPNYYRELNKRLESFSEPHIMNERFSFRR